MVKTNHKVFISYAHRDALDFVRRLAASLEMYVEVFWDLKLQVGQWEPQLFESIESADSFVVVMTQSRTESENCKKELDAANAVSGKIIPVKLYSNYEDTGLTHLQWADFSQSFDEGFRRLTSLILGQRLSSWEYLFEESNDSELLNHLEQGHIPALIGKELGDWILTEQLWSIFYNDIYIIKEHRMRIQTPRTPIGILKLVPSLSKIAEYDNSSILLVVVRELELIVREYAEEMKNISDGESMLVGRLVANTINSIREFFSTLSQLNNSTADFFYYSDFEFAVAENLRQLIVSFSRRSRNLY